MSSPVGDVSLLVRNKVPNTQQRPEFYEPLILPFTCRHSYGLTIGLVLFMVFSRDPFMFVSVFPHTSRYHLPLGGVSSLSPKSTVSLNLDLFSLQMLLT